MINTVLISFKDANSQSSVGLDNFKFVFTDSDMLRAIRNTAGSSSYRWPPSPSA